MKTKSWLLITLLAILVPLAARAAKDDPLREVRSFTGTITEWTYNEDYIYDGFRFTSGGENYLVKLPRYLGQAVRGMGNQITVNGVLRSTKSGLEIRVVSIVGQAETVYDVRPVAENPETDRFVVEKARVTDVRKNRKGEVIGYILDNNIYLRVSSNVARQLPHLSQPGAQIEYTGVMKALRPGEVSVNNYRSVRCQTLTVGGTQYLVR